MDDGLVTTVDLYFFGISNVIRNFKFCFCEFVFVEDIYGFGLRPNRFTFLGPADLLFSKVKANRDVCTAILEDLEEIQKADEEAEAKKSE